MARVVVVDDTKSVRDVLRAIIDEEPELDLVGEAANGSACIELVEERRPDILVIDAMMPFMDGMSAARELKGRFPELMIIAFTSSEELSSEMLAAGADMAFVKGDVDGVLNALRSAAHSGSSE